MIGGKKVGPRPELRDEIYRVAGVTQFHIYNSEQFLRIAGKHLGVQISEETIQAAKDVLEVLKEKAHLRKLRAEASPEEIVEEILPDFAADLVNSDEQITGAMAETNAFGYGLDEYEILSAEYNESKQQIEFEARLEISGDHDEDKPFCGDAMSVRVSGTIRYSRNGWIVRDHEIESCKVNW